jgi:hypothetical protein
MNFARLRQVGTERVPWQVGWPDWKATRSDRSHVSHLGVTPLAHAPIVPERRGMNQFVIRGGSVPRPRFRQPDLSSATGTSDHPLEPRLARIPGGGGRHWAAIGAIQITIPYDLSR